MVVVLKVGSRNTKQLNVTGYFAETEKSITETEFEEDRGHRK